MDNTISKAIIRINSKLNERFIFLIDEWDVIYREQEYNTKLCDEYTEFLRNLFKSSDVSACIGHRSSKDSTALILPDLYLLSAHRLDLKPF